LEDFMARVPAANALPGATPTPDLERRFLTDQTLLQRYLQSGDEAAFAVLVRRHGPMVRATCRRCLGESPDVDDAFQVVFLVLARKAASIRRRELLGPWLHMVAVRAARRLRLRCAQRQARERPVTPLPEPAPRLPAEPLDWLPVLDDELRRLPQKYLRPLVLCELQGLSRTEAAGIMGVPEGTLSSRLARGRDLLRQRLIRRGIDAPAGILTSALAAGVAEALPEALATTTIQAATAGAMAPQVAALTQGVLHTMFLARCKSVLLYTLTTALVGAALLLGAYLLAGPAGDKKGKSDKELLQGSWKLISAEMGGKKAEGEELDMMQKTLWVFKGDKLTVKFEGDFTIDSTKDPKHLDYVPRDGPEREKDKTFRCIYEIKGDQLKIGVSAVPDGARPANFTPQAGEFTGVIILRRVKN
jgi:RNA polymerase sigma factor (sigma-70 family)